MTQSTFVKHLLLVCLGAGIALAVVYQTSAQSRTEEPVSPAYIIERGGFRGGKFPNMKVTEFVKPARTFEVVLFNGDEVSSGLERFAEKHNIRAAHFTAIGRLDSAILGREMKLTGGLEVVSFTGVIEPIADKTLGPLIGKPHAHAHAIFSLADGSVKAGHFQQGLVSKESPFGLHVYITESDLTGAIRTTE